ncbi:polymorphic toxin-type HINT domain-containing protein, partial [Streptomyces sp. NPDC057623]|uniref:polymorphic toxin-type HINT domain-containing protein n=1 Tax=Streptomyces sp. NPDC057623 TaxID=3346187 RepID=UPI00367DD30C
GAWSTADRLAHPIETPVRSTPLKIGTTTASNGHCADGDYWNTPVMENSGPAQACFGKLACAKALRFLLTSDDVEQAKHIAATYCLANFNACMKDAKAYERGKLIESFVGALITGGVGIKGSKGVAGDCNCFLAGTDVLMAEGKTKDIEDIKVGDKVVATDPETGETGLREVTHLIVTDSDKHFNELSLATEEGTESLTATYEHPFWSPSQQRWIEAADLTAGMTLRTDDGSNVTVTANRPFTRHVRTYNLTVEDLHSYYVLAGDTPVLVHNSGPGCGSAWIDSNSVPHHFKHAEDFGIMGKESKATKQAFVDAIGDFVKHPGNVQIAGTYRGTPARHYVDLNSGRHVSVDLDSGKMLGAWKSDPGSDQFWYLTMHGKL